MVFLCRKPERGMEYLIEKGFVVKTPSAVARFLISRKGLSKQKIGEYLGCPAKFCINALECFAGEIDLCGLEIDQAMRKFQTYFRLPGEAQKIERVIEVCLCQTIPGRKADQQFQTCPQNRSTDRQTDRTSDRQTDEQTGSDRLHTGRRACLSTLKFEELLVIPYISQTFADRYLFCNPHAVRIFLDNLNILRVAYGIIMLNTDLHNPSIKKERKMTQDAFLKNMRGALCAGCGVSDSMLREIYMRVKGEEFKPGNDHVSQVQRVDKQIIGDNKPVSWRHLFIYLNRGRCRTGAGIVRGRL